ncbi:hypothetical protein [Pseudomonas putida]|uniref:hypothetical protein n=1 Tax=Pseudomonas putida TaxID=303 RepID=UPI002164D425|nr:hypothetical protein [Pseudomonas putida]
MDSKKHKTLARSRLFQSSLAFPLLLGLGLGVLIAINTELGELCFSSTCIRNFFDYFKFALTIAGASLPLAALVAAIHRSNEAAMQIEVASKQYDEAVKNNRFGNYLKHRESFEKLVVAHVTRGVSDERYVKPYIFPSSLYVKMFPESGFQAEAWHGEPDYEAFASLEHSVAMLMGQIKGDSFDIDIFFEYLQHVSMFYGVGYHEIQAVRLRSNAKVVLIVPKHEDVPRAIITLMNELVSLHGVVRTYIGKNDDGDLVWGRYWAKTHTNLSLSMSCLEIDKLAEES